MGAHVCMSLCVCMYACMHVSASFPSFFPQGRAEGCLPVRPVDGSLETAASIDDSSPLLPPPLRWEDSSDSRHRRVLGEVRVRKRCCRPNQQPRVRRRRLHY
eukprot:GHVU01070727.1.p3 GENE.GHVU01070727.1~~GHVU01070727.1.p3  ORF type:complete len:102 (-),score=5.45 GHVU01070727.1:358-663(-)